MEGVVFAIRLFELFEDDGGFVAIGRAEGEEFDAFVGNEASGARLISCKLAELITLVCIFERNKTKGLSKTINIRCAYHAGCGAWWSVRDGLRDNFDELTSCLS